MIIYTAAKEKILINDLNCDKVPKSIHIWFRTLVIIKEAVASKFHNSIRADSDIR